MNAQWNICAAEDGCADPSHSRNAKYCKKHDTRFRRHGDPLVVIAPDERRKLLGSANPRWLADDAVDYRTVHLRLKHRLGPARNHECADCGANKAVHWSYDHQDPDERVSPEGVPYSINLEHYQPRCASCHKFYDHAHLRREAVRKALSDLVAAAERVGNTAAAEFARSHLETEWPRFVPAEPLAGVA